MNQINDSFNNTAFCCWVTHLDATDWENATVQNCTDVLQAFSWERNKSGSRIYNGKSWLCVSAERLDNGNSTVVLSHHCQHELYFRHSLTIMYLLNVLHHGFSRCLQTFPFKDSTSKFEIYYAIYLHKNSLTMHDDKCIQVNSQHCEI